jgi:hypothetical protein
MMRLPHELPEAASASAHTLIRYPPPPRAAGGIEVEISKSKGPNYGFRAFP